MAHRVTLIPGDGIGPEVTEAARRVLEGTGVEFDWDIQAAGAEVMEREGAPLPERVLASLRANRVGLKGPVGTPVGKGFRSVNVGLRKSLDLFACLRPCKIYPGVRTRFTGVDLVIVRENTEDLYAGVEFEKGSAGALAMLEVAQRDAGITLPADSGVSLKPISVERSRRIVEFAFDYARRHGREKVTAVHKANIMKFSDGLFLEVAREVAKGHPDIAFEDRIVDNMCMQLVQYPERYDVLVLPNLYGDIVSDLAAGLVGGLGVAPGGNFGTHVAVFEPTHGNAPDIAGQHKANPIAMILSGVLMLQHLGEASAAARLERAVARVIREGRRLTPDMKAAPEDPSGSTGEVADAILAHLRPGA